MVELHDEDLNTRPQYNSHSTHLTPLAHLAPTLLSSSVLFVFPLAAAPSHKSSLLVFVGQLPPQGHLTIRRLPSHHVGLQQTAARPGVRQLGGSGVMGGGVGGEVAGRQQAGGAGRQNSVWPGHSTVGHQAGVSTAGPVRQEPVTAGPHPLSLLLVNLNRATQ